MEDAFRETSMEIQPVSSVSGHVPPPENEASPIAMRRAASTEPHRSQPGPGPTDHVDVSTEGRSRAQSQRMSPNPAQLLGKEGPPFLTRGPLGPVWVHISFPTFEAAA